MNNQKTIEELPTDIIYKLIKKNFEEFNIHRLLFKNNIQIVFKSHNNAHKKNAQLNKFNVEYFQFIVKIEKTFRSIMLCKKYRKVNKEEIDITYYFKDDDHKGLREYRDESFIPILKSIIRKLKIDNILKEL